MTDNAPSKPINPKLIFLMSMIIPGSGHVALGLPKRGLNFLFFIIVLFWAMNKSLPDASWYIRNVGGIFIWGLSVIDAYRIAKTREVEAKAE